jgi:glycolate oxidase FAD binding subunit
MRMADLLGQADVSADPPAWWPGAPRAGSGETLIRVSFWVSALGRVLDAIEAAAAKAGVSPAIEGSAGAGVLYLRVDAPSAAAAEFVGALRGALAGERGGVVVLAAPAGVRDELAGRGGMSAAVPGLALMQAVKDQFDPGHRMAPGRFPEGI